MTTTTDHEPARPHVVSPDCPITDYCSCGDPGPHDQPVTVHRYGSRGCRRARRERRSRS